MLQVARRCPNGARWFVASHNTMPGSYKPYTNHIGSAVVSIVQANAGELRDRESLTGRSESHSKVDIARSIHACDHLIYEVRILPRRKTR